MLTIILGLALILSIPVTLGGIIWIIVNAIRKDSLKKPIYFTAGAIGVFVVTLIGASVQQNLEDQRVQEELIKVNKEFYTIHTDAQDTIEKIDDLGSDLTSTWHDAIFGDGDKDFKVEVLKWETSHFSEIDDSEKQIDSLETKVTRVKNKIKSLNLELSTVEQNKLYALDKLIDHLKQYKEQALNPSDSLKNHDNNNEKALDKVKDDIDQIGTSFS